MRYATLLKGIVRRNVVIALVSVLLFLLLIRNLSDTFRGDSHHGDEDVTTSTAVESRDSSIPVDVGEKTHTTLLKTKSLRCPPRLYVIILVTSHAWEGYIRRTTIRETWGTYDEKRSDRANHVWQTMFVVGSRIEEDELYERSAEMAKLRQEGEIYGDIIEGDFVESDENLPLKLQIGFEWSHLYCPSVYIHKTDDDVFVNTRYLLPFLNRLPTTNIYTGHIQREREVHRTDRYKLTKEEYANDVYPPFASGATMTFTPDVITRLVGIFPKEKVIRLEGVYIGLLIEALGIEATELEYNEVKSNIWDLERGEKECVWISNSITKVIYFKLEIDRMNCQYQLYQDTLNS